MNTPLGTPPIYCRRCGKRLKDRVLTTPGRNFNTFTGEKDPDGKQAIRECSDYETELGLHDRWYRSDTDWFSL